MCVYNIVDCEMTPKKSKKLSIHFNFFDVIKGLKVITDLLGKFISALSKILCFVAGGGLQLYEIMVNDGGGVGIKSKWFVVL